MTPGYQALRQSAGVLDLGRRGLITVRGRDRARLLHNLTTNEVKKMLPGQGCYAFLLNPQGRIQADLNLLCFDDRFLLDTEPEPREKVYQHIRRYIIADQVELEDVTGTIAVLGLEGPGAAAVLAALAAPVPDQPYGHSAWGDATVAAVSITGEPGFRIVLPSDFKDDMMARVQAAGAAPATPEDARAVRIENGKPRYGEDIVETSLVQETRQMHAVSYTKGCYLGQEIVERVRARGHVNRVLVRLHLDTTEAPPSGAKVTAGDAEAGEVTSAVVSPQSGQAVALAYVRVPHADPGTLLTVAGSPARVA
jgi:folate-binding protein YgfZ